MPNFTVFGVYFIFETKFCWNEGNDACFNVKSVPLGGYSSLPSGYCSLPGGCCSLLVVTALYRSLLVVPTFSINGIEARLPFQVRYH